MMICLRPRDGYNLCTAPAASPGQLTDHPGACPRPCHSRCHCERWCLSSSQWTPSRSRPQPTVPSIRNPSAAPMAPSALSVAVFGAAM